MSASANIASSPTAPADGPAVTYRATIDDRIDTPVALALWERAHAATVFGHPAWWSAAIAAFGTGRTLHVLRILHGDATVALWPLWRKRLGPKELFASIVEPIGARVTDYCAPLLHRDHPRSVLLRCLLRAAMPLLDLHTVLLLPKLPQAGFDDDLVETCAAELDLLCGAKDRPCPSMALPATMGELERRWSKSHRGDVRRQLKRLRLAGRLELVTARDRGEVEAMLPRLTAMHADNWRVRASDPGPRAGAMPDFAARLARDLPLELLEASEVRLDGVAISSHFGFRDGRRLLWYKPTFDVGWASYAPGKVHIALAAERSIAEGLAEFDFMQGNEPYKRLWCDLTTVTKSFALARPMAYPLWAWTTSVRKFAIEYRI